MAPMGPQDHATGCCVTANRSGTDPVGYGGPGTASERQNGLDLARAASLSLETSSVLHGLVLLACDGHAALVDDPLREQAVQLLGVPAVALQLQLRQLLLLLQLLVLLQERVPVGVEELLFVLHLFHLLARALLLRGAFQQICGLALGGYQQ